MIPVGFILLISIALIAGVAVYAARGQDRVAVEASIHLARSVLADVQRDLGRTLIDYSFWDEVAKNLVISPDLDWVDDNVGEYVHDELNIDTTFALDPAGRLIYGMIDGKRSTDDPNRQLSGGLDILVSQALTTAPTEYPVPFTGFLKFGDDIHIAAASEVKNYVFQDDTEIVVPTGSVMIFTRRLSDDLLMQISQDFLLAGLHFVPPTGAMSAAELPLATVDGAQLGHLTWEVASPGRRMLYQIMPGVAIAFLIIAGLTFLVLHRGQGIVHAAINYREMATRKQADEQLAQYQKVETLGNLSGGMAHNLNNLLLPILVLTKSTLNELPQGSKGRERLEKVLEAGERAKILVSDVLNFSHKTEISANPLDFCASVQDSIQLLRPLIPSSVSLDVILTDDVGMVRADPTQIGVVLMNLASNAAGAMAGETGTLTISLTRVDADARLEHSVSNLDVGAYAKLSVKDTGQGMDEVPWKKMFDPFFTTKDVGLGTGLGLYSVSGIVSALDGAIDVISSPGGGTTIDVYFPLVDHNGTRGDPEEVQPARNAS